MFTNMSNIRVPCAPPGNCPARPDDYLVLDDVVILDVLVILVLIVEVIEVVGVDLVGKAVIVVIVVAVLVAVGGAALREGAHIQFNAIADIFTNCLQRNQSLIIVILFQCIKLS